MRGISEKSLYRGAFGLVMLTALVVRSLPLLGSNGAQESVDFDEGVYLCSAGLFSEGWAPYEDFALLHPPGILLLLWPLNILAPDILSWSGVLGVARWLGVLIGVTNVALVIAVAARWQGPVSGLVAGSLYASFRPAIYVEQHLVLEPFVVLFVLLGAYIWLRPCSRIARRQAAIAGMLLASAGLVKLTGGLALLALLTSPPRENPAAARLWGIAGAAGVSALVLVPFAFLAGPSQVWDQLILAQAQRPGDDVAGGSVANLSDRLVQAGLHGILGAEAVPDELAWLLLLVTAIAAGWALVGGGRDGRFWAISLLVLLAPPLAAPDWYAQYPVPAGAAMSVLLGAFSAKLLARLSQRLPRASTALAIILVTVLALGLINVGRDAWRERVTTVDDFGARVRAAVAQRECVVAVPPDLALAADRLPALDRSGTFLVDPFGALLVVSLKHEAAGTTQDWLIAPPAQARLRAALSTCRYVALNAEPSQIRYMSPETAVWFVQHFQPVPSAMTAGAVLWRVTT